MIKKKTSTNASASLAKNREYIRSFLGIWVDKIQVL